jgi:hypothetical protein
MGEYGDSCVVIPVTFLLSFLRISTFLLGNPSVVIRQQSCNHFPDVKQSSGGHQDVVSGRPSSGGGQVVDRQRLDIRQAVIRI